MLAPTRLNVLSVPAVFTGAGAQASGWPRSMRRVPHLFMPTWPRSGPQWDSGCSQSPATGLRQQPPSGALICDTPWWGRSPSHRSLPRQASYISLLGTRRGCPKRRFLPLAAEPCLSRLEGTQAWVTLGNGPRWRSCPEAASVAAAMLLPCAVRKTSTASSLLSSAAAASCSPPMDRSINGRHGQSN